VVKEGKGGFVEVVVVIVVAVVVVVIILVEAVVFVEAVVVVAVVVAVFVFVAAADGLGAEEPAFQGGRDRGRCGLLLARASRS
jgi:hypothetical protein